MKSRSGYRTPIPSISTRKATTKSLSFKDGVNTYLDNDDLKPTALRGAIDARFTKIGRYKTRRGLDRYSLPIGEFVNVQNAATTGASVATVSGTQAVAQLLSVGTAGRLSRVDVNIRSTSTSKGTVLVELWTNVGSTPTALVARSSIRSADITSSFAYKPVYFVTAPLLSVTSYYVVIRTQSQTAGAYEVSTTTAATTGKTSIDAGLTWSAASYSFNAKLYTADDSYIKGLIRTYRPNGQKVTVFAAGTTVYSVDDATGVTTAIKTGLSGSASTYRFKMIQDAIYWVNSQEKPYKWDFTTVTQITACPFIPDEIEEHVGLLIVSDSTDRSKFAWSNFGEYDKWTSTDFSYAPAPKSADGITAFAKLNGILYPFTRRNKFQLMGQDNATFQLTEAPSQRGTFTQESLVYDANYIFHADDEGIWKFNGSEERNLAEAFLEDYLAIPDKTTMQLDIFKNRLYVFFAPAGSADITQCYVYNLLLDKLESLDKNTIVGRTFGRDTQDDLFIQGSNRVAALYYAERTTNDYHNLGDQLQYEILTGASHFDAPASLKRVPKWRPVFASTSGDYSVSCGYAKDSEATFTTFDLPLGGSGPRFNTGVLFNSGVRFGGAGSIEPSYLFISGSFKRVQRRYQHVAAREPVEFDSEVLTVETQRVI
jgi:hypothetical protein